MPPATAHCPASLGLVKAGLKYLTRHEAMMAKVKKQPRPKAQAPKGFRDYFGAEVVQRTAMLCNWRGLSSLRV